MTDSCIISFDAWKNFIFDKTYGIPIKIKQTYYDLPEDKVKDIEYIPDYDFYNDEITEIKRTVNPVIIIPQDGLSFSIISIMAYCTGIMLNEYIDQMATNFQAIRPGGCRLLLKNEFTMTRTLLDFSKKHYASKLAVQEGTIIPEDGDKDLDVKGMDVFVKSTVNKSVREKLPPLLYEDILKSDKIDQIAIIKHIAMIEKEIFDSIQAGEKTYYKPVNIKSAGSYEKPMMIQGVKASVVYNALHEPGTEAIDTNIRNSLDIVKVEITKKNIETIKDQYPTVYENALNLMETVPQFKNGIDAIAIPLNEPTPQWVLPFVRYAEIINDNVSKFPLEAIGLYRGNSNNNSTNLIEF